MSEIFTLDLDEEILSHVATSEGWYALVEEGLTEALIFDDDICEMFVWQRDHTREHGRPATPVAFANRFDLDLAAPETAVGDLMERLRERFIKQEGRETLKRAVKVLESDPGQLSQALLREGRELSRILVPRGEEYGSGDYDRAVRHYHEKVLKGPGASFGFPELDDYFFGQRGLTFWLASKKGYKSWMAVEGVAANIQQGRAVVLYSLELPAVETNWRLYCRLADVPWWHYTRNAMTKDDLRRCAEAAELVDSIGAYVISKPPRGERQMDRLIGEARDKGASAVFIDQLQYVENSKGICIGEMNDTGDYFGVVNTARDLSDEGPICIVHQFNRAAQFADEMPAVEHAKGSASIEEGATVALGLWANKDMRRSGRVEIGTLISRNEKAFASWEMEVELSRGCRFEIVGRVDEE